jgi:adenylosuccinate synthase
VIWSVLHVRINVKAIIIFDIVQAKAYTTRVGAGPFPTELHGDQGEALRVAGHEFGTTTGRPRRCGWLDIVALNYVCTINGFTAINLTKLDVLSGLSEVKLGVTYRNADGIRIRSFPSDLSVLEQVQVRPSGHSP